MNKNGIIGIVIIIVLVILAIVGFVQYSKPTDTLTATSTIDANGNTTDNNDGVIIPITTTTESTTTIVTTPNTSGIKGNVTISPTCAGAVTPGQNCEKPYATTFKVSDVDGKFVKNFSSDVAGNFTVNLAPGQYKITQADPKIYPKMESVGNITVEDSTYTTLNISFDSGIR